MSDSFVVTEEPHGRFILHQLQGNGTYRYFRSFGGRHAYQRAMGAKAYWNCDGPDSPWSAWAA